MDDAEPSPSLEFEVEVVALQGIEHSEYRLGDKSIGFLRGGKRKLHPYVEVCCESREAQTRTVEAHDGFAMIEESLLFPVSGLSALKAMELKINVYDSRGVQRVVRGDPLIGSCKMGAAELACSGVQKITLMRKGEEQGVLTLCVGARASQGSYEVLADSTRKPLADVAVALSHVLAQPEGPDILLCALPEGLVKPAGTLEDHLRKLLQRWIVSLNSKAISLVGSCDRVALKHLSRLVRSAQQIMLLCVSACVDVDELQELSVAWVYNVFQKCLGAEGPPPTLNEHRLRLLLHVSSLQGDDPRGQLEAMGVSLPADLSDEVVQAIAARLKEAAETEEYEMFTGEQVVEDEQVTPGMAAVVRVARSGDCPHVFLYHLESIQEWVRVRGHDPSTRETIDASDILPLANAAPGP